jgi:hypothetical protein
MAIRVADAPEMADVGEDKPQRLGQHAAALDVLDVRDDLHARRE